MRRPLALAIAGVLVAGASIGAGVAVASSTWTAATVGAPKGYFDFCQDKQRDIAGLTDADLAGENNGGNDYGITAAIYPNDDPGATLAEQNSYDSPGFLNFVNSKSGITVDAATGPERQLAGLREFARRVAPLAGTPAEPDIRLLRVTK